MNYFLKKNIKFLRRSRGLSQQEMANQLGLTRNKIATYESGNSEPNIRNLKKIIDFFGVSFDNIISTDLELLPELPKHRNSEEKNIYNDKLITFKEKLTTFTTISVGLRALLKFRKRNANGQQMLLSEAEATDLLDITEATLNWGQEIIEDFADSN